MKFFKFTLSAALLINVALAASTANSDFECPKVANFGLKMDPVENNGFSASGPGLGNRIAGSYFPFAAGSLSGDKKTLFCMYKVGSGQVAFYSKAAPEKKTCIANAAGFSCK